MTDEANASDTAFTQQAEQEIKRINQAWVQALTVGDTATLDQLMADDCIFAYALDGDDKAQFLADIAAGQLRVAELNREHVEIRIHGSTGVLIAFDTADWNYKGHHITGYYRTMHVYAHLHGRWQIVAIQASPIAMK